MKTNLLLLFFLVSFINVNAQKWCSPGAEWTYSLTGQIGGFSKIIYEKDTLVDLKLCNKLSLKETVIYSPTLIMDFYKVYFTYTNQDTVFIFQDNLFKPLYYFNANVGDTLEFGDQYYITCPNYKKVVYAKGNMIINNDTLRYYDVIVTNCNDFYFNPKYLRIVEKFGCFSSYILPAYNGFTDPQIPQLDCYHDDKFGELMFFPGAICEPTTSTTNVESIDFVIYPNPANETISISGININSIESIEITNGNGSKVLSINKSKTNLEFINISELVKGIYFIKVITTDGKQGTKKFIKL